MSAVVRLILISLLAWLPVAGFAQSPTPAAERGLSPDLVAMATWVRKISAAQQPSLNVYTRCQSVTTRAAAAFASRAAAHAVMPDLIRCITEFEVASRQSAEMLATVGAMPRSFELAWKMDSAAYLRRAAAVIEGMAASLRELRIGLEAAQAGDQATASGSLLKVQAGSVAAIDAQILSLELIAKTAPNQSSRAVMKLRLTTAQALRAGLAAPITPQGAAVGTTLTDLVTPAQGAARDVRSAWANDGAELRRLVSPLNDPRRSAMVDRVDAVYMTIAARADALADDFKFAPSGVARPPELAAFMRKLTEFDIFLVDSASALSASIQEQR